MYTSLPNWTASNPPQYPFLRKSDPYLNPVPSSEYCLHGNGSFIVFADGHVKHFTIDYYPNGSLKAETSWDATTKQWYHFYYANPATEDEVRLNKTIAVSP